MEEQCVTLKNLLHGPLHTPLFSPLLLNYSWWPPPCYQNLLLSSFFLYQLSTHILLQVLLSDSSKTCPMLPAPKDPSIIIASGPRPSYLAPLQLLPTYLCSKSWHKKGGWVVWRSQRKNSSCPQQAPSLLRRQRTNTKSKITIAYCIF